MDPVKSPLVKKVFKAGDIELWEKSEAYQDIMGFLMAMNNSVKGKKLSAECNLSPVLINLCKMLEKISGWADEIKPIDQPQRYGNKAFRTFYNKLKENSSALLVENIPENFHEHIPEVSTYLTESFGNSTRIDYGTGHELAFIMFLCCLHKIEVLKREDSITTVTILFKRYMDLARKLQKVYKMEPAGSQGVWSLDDFQFIPFIWGSSQLIMNPKITPDMFTQVEVVNNNADEYLFLGGIQYIMSVKTGPFAEHSNQLWNISGVKSWTKINQGLFKMYKAEILNKFPVIQHVLFGSILSFKTADKIMFHPTPNMDALKSSVGMMGVRAKMGGPPMMGVMPNRPEPPLMGVMPPPPQSMTPSSLTANKSLQPDRTEATKSGSSEAK